MEGVALESAGGAGLASWEPGSVVVMDSWGLGCIVECVERAISKGDSDWGFGAASKEVVILEKATGARTAGEPAVGETCRGIPVSFVVRFCSGVAAELPSSILLFGGRPRSFLT